MVEIFNMVLPLLVGLVVFISPFSIIGGIVMLVAASKKEEGRKKKLQIWGALLIALPFLLILVLFTFVGLANVARTAL